ncbi:MAG: hypothetical protein LBJ48_04575 [Coriobacteriales bacterium]|jgi:hypothetical protein|nr:hypothetical protein [Coriobacteriales bacterium]
MKTAATTSTASQWERALLRVSLITVLALLLLQGFSGFSAYQAYADEPQTTPSQEQQSSGSGTEYPGYTVYSFNSQDIIDAQTNQSGRLSNTAIPDSEVPLAGFSPVDQSPGSAGKGSSFNTLMAALCGISLAVMLLVLFVRRAQDYRILTIQTVAVAFGLVTIATWALLDRLQIPITTFNDASVLIAVLTGVSVVVAVASCVFEARLKKVRKTQNR